MTDHLNARHSMIWLLNKGDLCWRLTFVLLLGWLHNSVQMERQWLLLPSVTPPLVSGHGCRIFGDLQQTPPDLVQQFPEACSLSVEQGSETVRPSHGHTRYGGRLRCQTLSSQWWSVYMLNKIHRGLQGDALGRCHVQGGPDISLPRIHGVPACLCRQVAVCHLGQRLFTDTGLPVGHQEGSVCAISGAEYPGASSIFSNLHWWSGVPARIQLQGKNSDIWAPHDWFEQLNPLSNQDKLC